MKKLIALVLILCMACVLCGCLEDTDPKTTIGDNTASVSDTGTDSDSAKENVQMATVGQNVTGKIWKVSFLSAKVYDQIGTDLIIDKPEAGNKLLVLFFEVENISDKDDFFNSLYFESYVDGYSANLKLIYNDPDGVKDLSGTVSAGKKLKGQICMEVPEDWKEAEIYYNESVFGSVKLKFVVTPDKVAQ